MASLAHQTQIQEFVGYPIEKLLDCDNKPENTVTAFFTYGRFQPGHRSLHMVDFNQDIEDIKL